MAQSANHFVFFHSKPTEDDLEKQDLLEAMKENRDDLKQARAYFNRVHEPELIEASVYEINSLQARYAYLLRRLREQEEKRTVAPVMKSKRGGSGRS